MSPISTRALAVPCPHCKASRWAPCVGTRGPVAEAHFSRRQAVSKDRHGSPASRAAA